jgi:arabinose-5-phosphate isomerase
MGKAGLVGAKISATFASTGTPSLALHPAEAMHGDLGRIRAADTVLALSNSGETTEIKALIPRVRSIGAGVIAMTGVADSTLGRLADCVLDIGPVDEACPLGLAPTASTSAMLALGDALAMVVLDVRGFSHEDYARYHPSGSLGRKLMKVREIMRQGEELPLVPTGTPITEVVLTMSATKGRPGAALVVTEDGRLGGLFTDGDLRRLIETNGSAGLDQPVDEFMTRTPKTAHPDQLLEEAERLLREHKKDQVPVIDDDGRPVGLLDVQDVLNAKV